MRGRDFEELQDVLVKKYAGTELTVPELPEKKQGINKVCAGFTAGPLYPFMTAQYARSQRLTDRLVAGRIHGEKPGKSRDVRKHVAVSPSVCQGRFFAQFLRD